MSHSKKFFSVVSTILLVFLILLAIKDINCAKKDTEVSVVPIFAEKSATRRNECQSGDLFFKIGKEQLKTGCGIVHCQSDCKCGIFG